MQINNKLEIEDDPMINEVNICSGLVSDQYVKGFRKHWAVYELLLVLPLQVYVIGTIEMQDSR